MNRSSPGVKRIAAILDFMAEHPGQTFSLTDLVRALKLSRATTHALLTGLVEVGYLYRTQEKNYLLGPALAAIGRAAAISATPLQVAQPEMRRLADHYDVVCSAFFREGDFVHVRERAASVSHLGNSAPAGSRLRLRTPFAAPFLAWSDADAAAWLDAPQRAASPAQREELQRSLIFAREHGFVLLLKVAEADQAPRSAEQIFAGENAGYPITPAVGIDVSADYQPASILAPVFGSDGRVVFVMGLAGFETRMTGAELISAAEQLCAACERIAKFGGEL